ncbi:kinase-like domain-containing protein [Pestalotiopsis sp. NC0098]|nr:kinase-like domain-containing protein [Pestalotiopsis sp. NC0098]
MPAKVVRLEIVEKESQSLSTIAAIQQIAATAIPDLVPDVYEVGKMDDSRGRTLHFSITEFVDGETLQDVWWKLNATAQDAIVQELGEAIEKLHTVRPSAVPHRTGGRLGEQLKQPGIFGGPHTGFMNTGSALLASIMEQRKLKKQFCTTEGTSDPEGIVIQSNFEDLGALTIEKADSDKWSEEAVLCHNDLNPRNIIIRQKKSQDGTIDYRLAAIIDWELAGFYPASYELSLQDTHLSTGNQHLSYYLKLKSRMKTLVPRTLSQIQLLKANELVYESQQRHLGNGTNIPAHIRKIFMEYFQLVRDDDPYVGWISELKDNELPPWSNETAQKMEDDAIQAMLVKRQKARAQQVAA